MRYQPYEKQQRLQAAVNCSVCGSIPALSVSPDHMFSVSCCGITVNHADLNGAIRRWKGINAQNISISEQESKSLVEVG